jgi:hypothetical protein
MGEWCSDGTGRPGGRYISPTFLVESPLPPRGTRPGAVFCAPPQPLCNRDPTIIRAGRDLLRDRVSEKYYPQTLRPGQRLGGLSFGRPACWHVCRHRRAEVTLPKTPPCWSRNGEPAALCAAGGSIASAPLRGGFSSPGRRLHQSVCLISMPPNDSFPLMIVFGLVAIGASAAFVLWWIW